MKNKILTSLLISSTILVVGCGVLDSGYNEEEIGLRKSNLYNENVELKDEIKFLNKSAGESALIKRSFENAPPLIPHDLEGLIPITKDYNSCLDCHDQAVASSVGSVAIPQTHMRSFRPIINLKDGKVLKDGKKYVNTADIISVEHKRDRLSSDRYNCTLCHVSQTDNKPLVDNSFNPDFRDINGSKKSNLIDILNEGVE